MKYRLLTISVLLVMIFFFGCNTIFDEITAPDDNPPDSLGFVSVTSAGITLKYKVEETDLHCIISGNTSGWLSVGINPSSKMKDADFIIGYVSGGDGFMRDDWGISNTIHVSDESLGGTDDITMISASETGGITEMEFKIPLNSGDQYDKVLDLEQTYPVILARGNNDDFDSMHSGIGYANITISATGGTNSNGHTSAMPDTTQYLSLEQSGMKFYWRVDPDTIHVVVSAPTTGWVGIGFDQENVMEGANFIIGYVESDTVGYFRDDWGSSSTDHISDVDNGGTEDLYYMGGMEANGETIIYFSMPLNSGDTFDKPLVWDESYPIILAYGSEDSFISMHAGADFSSFTVDNTTGGGGGGGNGNVVAFPDTSQYLSLEASGMRFWWLVDTDTIHVVVSAPTMGWVGIGFDQENVMESANFIIGYVENDSIGYLRDDWGNTPSVHSSDIVNGGTEDIYYKGGLETGGETFIYFSMPLDSGDTYDKPLVWDESYPIILAYGTDDSYSSMHTAADFSSFTVDNVTGGGGGGGNGNVVAFPDTTQYLSLEASGMRFWWLVDTDTIHVVVSAPTMGWVGIGFDQENVMESANFIIGYVENDSLGFLRDDWGNSPTVHSADVDNGGTEDIYHAGGLETGGESFIYFSMPLDSGDSYDKPLLWDQSYPVILAYGDNDNYSSMHTAADFSSFTVDNVTGGGGGGGGNNSTFPDTTLYLSLDSQDMRFYWLVDPDTIHVVVSAPTSGWVAVGFDQDNVMQGANFIIGYVENDSLGYVRDDWGINPTSHSADIGMGGTEDLYHTGGLETGGESFIYFSMPLDSGDNYDKPLLWDQNYPLILAYGNSDDFSSIHDYAGFASFTVDNTTGGGDNGVTTGGDISLDDDTLGFNSVTKSDMTFKWKVVGDSVRCMVLAPTTGWLAIGFDPTEEMQDANFIIGYVNEGTAYVRDDFGVSETMHSADIGLGGENHVRRVFGHEAGGSSEIRFTIPLNSGDQYDRILIPGQTYEIIFAMGFNGADDFTSMHDEEDNEDIQF